METQTLQAQERTLTGKKVKQLRAKGLVPAVVYGKGFTPIHVAVDAKAFVKTLAAAGESSLVDLSLPKDGTVKVLIQDVAYAPLSGDVVHADFRQVNMNEKIDVEVALRFQGEAPAVKALGGILVKSMDSIAVRCLPGNLVHEFDVDLSSLGEIGAMIHVKDIAAPEGVEILANEDDVIAIINEPISEAELSALDEKPDLDVSQVKVASEEKKKEEAEAGSEE